GLPRTRARPRGSSSCRLRSLRTRRQPGFHEQNLRLARSSARLARFQRRGHPAALSRTQVLHHDLHQRSQRISLSAGPAPSPSPGRAQSRNSAPTYPPIPDLASLLHDGQASREKREPSRDGRKPARVHNKSGTDEPIRPTGNVLPCEPFFSDLSSGTSTSRLRRAHGPPLLEAFPAKDRPPLRRPEGTGGVL